MLGIVLFSGTAVCMFNRVLLPYKEVSTVKNWGNPALGLVQYKMLKEIPAHLKFFCYILKGIRIIDTTSVFCLLDERVLWECGAEEESPSSIEWLLSRFSWLGAALPTLRPVGWVGLISLPAPGLDV